ncbi:ras-related protein Rab-44-like isoform X2 [Planococcus citri]|uniref:ras-related protein Rab-44-like isoform X2 n=1 Tax=Planococcus citri TaxID=170843 RepID=UPI0031F8D1B3
MSDKAKTLPRAKRDKSPSPSSSSFSSLKTATVGKINSFRGINPLRNRKKKYTVNSVSSVDSSDAPTVGSSSQDLNDTPELPEEMVGEPDATSTPTTATVAAASLDAVQPTQKKLKTPKKAKPPNMKKIVKGGKGILSKLKGKNESAAIIVDTPPLDLRRGGAAVLRKEANGGAPAGQNDDTVEEQEELKNGDIGEMPVTTKDEWSVTATCEKARNSTDKNELLFKILVIGELGTGKTSIIKRYVHQFFSQHYRATIGVDFALKVLQWDNESMIRLQLWDIAGQERFGNMTRVYYKEAVGAFIVFDVTRVSTFEAVTKWKQDLDAKVQLANGETIPCVLLANKCDQPKEGIVNNHSKMDEFCKDNQFVAWFETSAKDNINIDEAANCLVAKIVQNDQKRLEEKETTNGTGVINVNSENSETTKSKVCGAC